MRIYRLTFGPLLLRGAPQDEQHVQQLWHPRRRRMRMPNRSRVRIHDVFEQPLPAVTLVLPVCADKSTNALVCRGGNCSAITCGNPIARPSNRTQLVDTATSTGCTGSGQCTSGFNGLDCNICENSNACSAAIATFGAANTSTASIDPSSGLMGADEMQCSNSPYTYTSSFIECNVINPTLQGVFPGTTILYAD